MSEDEEPFGPEWAKEMMNFPKKILIKRWLKPNLIKIQTGALEYKKLFNALEDEIEENKRLTEALENVVYADGDSLGQQYTKMMEIAEKALNRPKT